MYNKLYGFQFPKNAAYMSIEFDTKSEQLDFQEVCHSFMYRTVLYSNRTGYEVRFYPHNKKAFVVNNYNPRFTEKNKIIKPLTKEIK